MGLSPAGNPADRQARGASAHCGYEIRERKNCARACLVGSSVAAGPSRTARSSESAGGWCRAGQKAVECRTETKATKPDSDERTVTHGEVVSKNVRQKGEVNEVRAQQSASARFCQTSGSESAK